MILITFIEHTNHEATHYTSFRTLLALPAPLNPKHLPQHPVLGHAHRSHDAPRPHYSQSLNICSKQLLLQQKTQR
jgi:hypothetical protein